MTLDTEAIYVGALTWESAQQKAQELGCDIEVADDQTLQIDHDTIYVSSGFWDRYDLIAGLGLLGTHSYPRQRRSRNGHWHITIKLDAPMLVEKRIMLQSLLGSDLKREALSLARVQKGVENPVILFRPKGLEALEPREEPEPSPFDDDDLPF